MHQPSFFDQRGIADLGSLPGASGTHIIDWLEKGRYAAKRYDHTKPWTLVSEWLCADIASLLGLPIPARQVIAFNGNWLGFEWRGEAKAFNPGMENHLINKEVIPGMIAFDVWVCNRDRHHGNILLQRPSDSIPEYTLSLIDHSHALIGDFGSMSDLLLYIQQGGDPRHFVYQIPQELRSMTTALEDYEQWLNRIEGFDYNRLGEIAEAIPYEWVPNRAQLVELVQLITTRASKVRLLIMDNPQLFVF